MLGSLLGGATGGGGFGGTSTNAASGSGPQDSQQNIYFGGANSQVVPTWAIVGALAVATFYAVRSKK